MTTIAPFNISCPTSIRFGAGVHAALADVLPAGARTVVLVRGRSGVAVAPLRGLLAELEVIEVICASEPSVDGVNTMCATIGAIRPDAVIACGGGAVIDTGKALTLCIAHDLQLPEDFGDMDADLLAHPLSLPLIVLPTTAGTGAEVTSNAVLDVASKRAKISLRGRALFPHAALIDSGLMQAAPAQVLLNSGLDAITQTMEAYSSAAATAFSDALTAPNLDRGLHALRGVIERGCPDAMNTLAWVSLSSGLALANSGLGAAHGLASVVGGRYAAPHGALCGRFLIPVLRQNCIHVGDDADMAARLDRCIAAIAAAFPPANAAEPLSGFEGWLEERGLARLREWGVARDDFSQIAAASVGASSSRKNGVVLDAEDHVAILHAAY